MPPVANSEKLVHQVVIIGSGPAAHTAAIYLGRAQLKPVLYEGFLAGGVAPGGQLTTTTEVENFPGFPEGITGSQLMDRMREQSVKCETTIHTETIAKVDFSQRPFKLWTEAQVEENAEPVLTHSVILATGATARRMYIPGEDKYWNAGISACAVCDGAAPIFRNKPLAVVGGGDTACEEATYLTRYASKVFLLVRRNQLRASKVMQERVMKNPKVEIMWNAVPVEAQGEKLLKKLVIHASEPTTGKPYDKDHASFQESTLEVSGLFYAIGHVPNTSFIKDEKTGKLQLKTDAEGYILHEHPGQSTMTSIEGVFAAGDVVDKQYRQAVTAAGSGCASALDCERWLEGQDQ
ncbi:hypothetical protein MIR68_007308 [Amoeboaphelidium protococcarum]|nr:hypothetical protein MIR68_007308 [Amoeboaphelidium protococcarum]